MPALALETEFRSDQQITADFLSYMQSKSSGRVAYDVEPSRLTGGFDARLYRFKLVGQEPRVLRILRPAREVEELLHHQVVHQILNQQGLKVPVIHHVCADQSVLGGVFAVMDLVPGDPLFEQKPEVFASILGESMARMHELDVRPIVESFRRAGVPDERFLSPVVHQKALDFVEQTTPWAADLMVWLRDHLPLDGDDLAVIHGDYHAGNVMFRDGAVSGLLDWDFRISDPALDLASTMNIHLIFTRQIDPTVSPHLCEQFVDGVLGAYQVIRPLNHQRIKLFRVFHIFRVLALGVAGIGPEFLRKPSSQCEYLAFIERMTGLTLSPLA
ncbi:hypothetical protein KR52_05565 [Synechococcus sp. KORDI-52]|nr:hypothetical protein KR52_05565 [Synechococcus sp. KORDI-52]